jgi:hypothetical protein
MKMSVQHRWNDINKEKQTYWKQIVPVPLCPPQISHEMTWDWAVRGRSLTAWAIARRSLCSLQYLVYTGQYKTVSLNVTDSNSSLGCEPRTVHVSSAFNKVAMGQHFGVPLSVSFHQYCKLHVALSRQTTCEDWEAYKNASSGIGKHWLVFGLKHIWR